LLLLKKPTRALKAFSMAHRRLAADKMVHLVSQYFCGANSDYKINPLLKVNRCHFNCIYMYMTVSSGCLVWQEYLIRSTGSPLAMTAKTQVPINSRCFTKGVTCFKKPGCYI